MCVLLHVGVRASLAQPRAVSLPPEEPAVFLHPHPPHLWLHLFPLTQHFQVPPGWFQALLSVPSMPALQGSVLSAAVNFVASLNELELPASSQG